jgi:hypothetical protein
MNCQLCQRRLIILADFESETAHLILAIPVTHRRDACQIFL